MKIIKIKSVFWQGHSTGVAKEGFQVWHGQQENDGVEADYMNGGPNAKKIEKINGQSDDLLPPLNLQPMVYSRRLAEGSTGSIFE